MLMFLKTGQIKGRTEERMVVNNRLDGTAEVAAEGCWPG